MLEALPSFTPFLRLPKELQIRIWECSVQTPCVVARIVRVDYSPTTDFFSYSFPPQPALEVCRLSREVALRFYLPLVSGSTHPVYFNPKVDFLYCKWPLDLSDLDSTNLSPESPVLPFVPPHTNVSIIRFLVLDRHYWQHRAMTNFRCPIMELRDFKNLEEIFILALSIEQSSVRMRQAFSERPDDPRFDFDRHYARELLRDAAAPSASISGFCLYPSGTDRERVINTGLINSFAWQDNLSNTSDSVYCLDEFWGGRMLPKATEIRAVHTYTPADSEIISLHFEAERTKREQSFRHQTSFKFENSSEATETGFASFHGLSSSTNLEPSTSEST